VSASVRLPTVDEVAQVATAELPAFAARLASLLVQTTLRLQAEVRDQGDDCEAWDVEEAARRIGCSVDLVREHGEAWGIALVLSRDRNGKPTRTIYPRARLQDFLAARPAAVARRGNMKHPPAGQGRTGSGG